MTIDNKRKISLKTNSNKTLPNVESGFSDVACKSLFNKLIINVSDKLRTPLFVIKSYSQLLQRNNEKERLFRGLKLMESASGRMEKTIVELLSLVNIYTQDTPSQELVYFREMYDEAYGHLYNTLELRKDIKLDVDFSGQAKLWFNKPLLKIIFAELISNAILHNLNESNLKISIRSYKLINHTILEVKDNGGGFDIFQLREHITDPFNSQSTLAQCVGVGLSKIEAIAKVTNSLFEIKSKVNQGTVCRFYFQ